MAYEFFLTNSAKVGRGRVKKAAARIGTPRKGSLGGPGYTRRSVEARHAVLREHLRKYGYASTIAALQSRINLGHTNMDRRSLDVFELDKAWLQKQHQRGETMAKKKKSKKKGAAAFSTYHPGKKRRRKKSGKKRSKKKGKKRAKKKSTSRRRPRPGSKARARVCKPKRKAKVRRAAARALARKSTPKKARKRAGKALAYGRWCRNFQDLTVPENELDQEG